MEGTVTPVRAVWGWRGPQPEFLQLAGRGLRGRWPDLSRPPSSHL